MSQTDRTRVQAGSKRYLAALVGLPIVANLVLIAGLLLGMSTIGSGQAGGGSDGGFDVAPPATGLPVGGIEAMLASVKAETGHEYACIGPWETSGSILNWACRHRDAVVRLYGSENVGIFRLDATWFGFDSARTDLPAWAAATQAEPELADRARQSVSQFIGTAAEFVVGTVSHRTSGARGALWLGAEAR